MSPTVPPPYTSPMRSSTIRCPSATAAARYSGFEPEEEPQNTQMRLRGVVGLLGLGLGRGVESVGVAMTLENLRNRYFGVGRKRGGWKGARNTVPVRMRYWAAFTLGESDKFRI